MYEKIPVLFVNLPGRITPRARLYPLGHEGVIPLPPPTNADLLVQVHTGRKGVAFERMYGAVLPPLPYSVELAGAPLAVDDLRAAKRVLLLAHRDGPMQMEEAGAVLPPREAGPPLASFDQQIAALSVSCTRRGPHQVSLAIEWQASGLVVGNPTVFAHLLAADGSLVTQADGYPLRGLYPFKQWRPEEIVHDLRTFDDVPPGPAVVALGVWDPAAGVRWEALGADGETFSDNALKCQVPAWE